MDWDLRLVAVISIGFHDEHERSTQEVGRCLRFLVSVGRSVGELKLKAWVLWTAGGRSSKPCIVHKNTLA